MTIRVDSMYPFPDEAYALLNSPQVLTLRNRLLRLYRQMDRLVAAGRDNAQYFESLQHQRQELLYTVSEYFPHITKDFIEQTGSSTTEYVEWMLGLL